MSFRTARSSLNLCHISDLDQFNSTFDGCPWPVNKFTSDEHAQWRGDIGHDDAITDQFPTHSTRQRYCPETCIWDLGVCVNYVEMELFTCIQRYEINQKLNYWTTIDMSADNRTPKPHNFFWKEHNIPRSFGTGQLCNPDVVIQDAPTACGHPPSIPAKFAARSFWNEAMDSIVCLDEGIKVLIKLTLFYCDLNLSRHA